MESVDVIHKLFTKSMGMPADFILRDEMSSQDVPGWDSLGQLSVLMDLEEIIGRSLDMDEVADLTTVGAFRRILGERT